MIPFVKMHADGNDFLLVHERYERGDRAHVARRLCDRHRGVGADGVEWISEGGDGVHIALSNADGSHAEISGNGTRCVAAWWAASHSGEHIGIATDAGLRECRILERFVHGAAVEIAMGVPAWERSTVTTEDGRQWNGVTVQVGNPHFVLVETEIPENWQQTGAGLTAHPGFPGGTNVEFVRVDAPDAITFRIYERGAGPTQSSGTGSTASAVAAIAVAGAARRLRVHSEGGTQIVEWPSEPEPVRLTGEAYFVARGEAYL